MGSAVIASKPYWAGLRPMIIAAMMSGTYSRVSRGRYLLVADSCQKSSIPAFFIARDTRPGPPL